mgnify:FL=1
MSLWDKAKGVLNKMLGKDTIQDIIKVKPVISSEMENAIQLWSDMYKGKAPWLKSGSEEDPEVIVSLGLPALIASEKARMATLEMESEITAPMQDVEVENPDYEPPGVDETTGLLTMGHGSMTKTESQPIGPTERAEYLNKQYIKLLDNIRTQLEYGCAKGGLVIKPYVREFSASANISNEVTEADIETKQDNPAIKDVDKQSSFSANSDVAEKDSKGDNRSADNSGGNAGNNSNDIDVDDRFTSASEPLPQYEIEFDFVQADRFYPLSIDAQGRVTEACFVQQMIKRDMTYSRLEYHQFDGRSVTVKNFAFEKANVDQTLQRLTDVKSQLGKEIPLASVTEWANIAPEVTINDVDRPLFAYFRMPEANTIDTYSPLGVSCYSRVVNLIKNADEQYSRLLWEFEGGELAVDVDRDAMRPEIRYDNNGIPITKSTLPRKQQRLFRNVDLNSEETYNVFAPALRDASISNGLNIILMRIEDATGLSRGTISEDPGVAMKTATELKINKQRSFSANADIQHALEKALRDAVYVMDVYATLYNITPAGQYEISFEWDDSILVDRDSELANRMTLIEKGVSGKVETRMWYFGETENQAKQALQRIEDERKASMETNIVSQQEIGIGAQGKDFSEDNNNPGTTKENSVVNNG